MFMGIVFHYIWGLIIAWVNGTVIIIPCTCTRDEVIGSVVVTDIKVTKSGDLGTE